MSSDIIKNGNELANRLNDIYTFILCNINVVNSKNDKQSVISNFIYFLNAPSKYPQA